MEQRPYTLYTELGVYILVLTCTDGRIHEACPESKDTSRVGR